MSVMSAETVYDYIDVFKKQFYRLTTVQKEAFMELVRKKIGDIMPRDEDEVIALGPFVMYLKDEEIKNLTPEAAQEAVLQLISSRLEEIPKSVKSTLLKKLMQLKGKARALGRDMALRDLTDDDVRECAAVMVDIKPDEIDQLPEQYIKGIVEAMAELAHKLSAQQKQRLLQRYKQAIRGDGDLQDAFTRLTKDDVDTLGGILEAASVADLQKIPNQIVKGLSDVFGQMQFDKEKAGVIWSKMESASRRKKRNADMSSRSGADLIAMGSMLVALSKEEIATVSTAAFDEAAGVIGAQKGFSAEQLTSWAAKAKQAWNSPSSFTAEQLGRLGIMVAGFTPEELGTMLLRANDVVESLGSLRLEGSNGEPGYTASHLSKALAQVVKLKGKAISAFEGDDLIALKNFSLGMTPSDIESISTAAFGSAGGSLGDISGWSADHQRALKSRFVAVYGSVDTWTTAEVRDTGAAIGGLTASELQALSADHVSMIKPTAIAEMPANLFKEFSTEQLTALDSSQADFVTMAQMDALPADKKGILNKKKGSVNTPGSGAMISTAPQSVVALVLAYFSAVYAA
ncbi:uncharacterized protein LOC5517044 [Nematostella vectensis]|uniref:uncharacterized protein LOC5517044 n=1 Tax=Nematostella vectensis TaxID=45351 RepID=UPI0020770A5B|nr:uncharacterized protein LOC5517044 [Nematostella vectensis]XP_048581008.1 uncharacterized protein LOC5517044 [Nematostella vectensis]